MRKIVATMPGPYVNVDGVVESDPERAIGSASFILSARSTGGTSALPVEQSVLEEICTDGGGCQMSLSFRQFSLFDNEPKSAIIVGPCTFSYSADSGAWVTGAGCDDAGPRSGIDGDQRASLEAEGSAVAEVAGACVFAESEAVRAVEDTVGFQRDHARGMYLVVIPERQPDGIRRFQCELSLE